MTPLRFTFVLHLHQPVGNFDFVFREHAEDVYRPFLDFLDERELWPIGLHVSGPLLEWLGDHDRPLHDRIGRLAADGKAELLSAGWYEPILASLGPADRATQLGWMRQELEARFGVTPRGLWLTERVWVPEVAADLADAGIVYTLVDDHLARRAGATDDQLLRPLQAEHDGRGVDVLAIDQRMRYLIPFTPADEVEAALRARHAAGDPLALFADDAEKFGGWPRTRAWLYDQGWLQAFGEVMDRLRDEEIIRLVAPGRALDELGRGPVLDFPVGSYAEMDEWADGAWTNFLDRYAEAGRLHTWMSELSRACRAAGDPDPVRRAVGRAQCNDAYWHGVFGGLYMKHLREGVRRWMAEAERGLRPGAALVWEDTRERDGTPSHRVRSDRISARVSGAAGGTLTELVWLKPDADVTDYLTRRLEAYHEPAVARGRTLAEERGHEGAPSIHQIEEEATLARLPSVDPDVRVLVRARVLGASISFDAYRDGTFEAHWAARDAELTPPDGPVAAGAGASDAPHSTGPGDEARGAGSAPPGAFVWRFPPEAASAVGATIVVAADRVEVEWRWDPSAFPPDAWFAPEVSLGCPVDLVAEPEPAETWRYPIVTVSKCPDGFEEIEQGRSVTPRWPIGVGRARVVLRPMAHPASG